MSDTSKPGQDHDEMVAGLLRLAGPRTDAPPDVQERVRGIVHSAWQQTVASRRRRRLLWSSISLAAAAVLLIVLLLPTRRDGGRLADSDLPAGAGLPAGTLILSLGTVNGPDGAALSPGSSIRSGTTLETTEGRAAIRLLEGGTIRLDSATRLTLEGSTRLALERGAIYVESDEGATRSGRLEIRTRAGIIRDVGTRFEVRVTEDKVRLRVRHGVVALHHEASTREVPSGAELTVDGTGGIFAGSVPLYGPEWDWILDVTPGFDLEGRNLGEFLDWVSSETGLAVRFAEDGLERSARSIVLHGSVAGLRADRAPEVVLPTCGMSHRVVGDTLIVGREDS